MNKNKITLVTKNDKGKTAIFNIIDTNGKIKLEVEMGIMIATFNIIIGDFAKITLYNSSLNDSLKYKNAAVVNKIDSLFSNSTSNLKNTGVKCDCQTVNRDDGTNVIQCNPHPIAFDNSTEVGVSLASNGQDNFITVAIRFLNSKAKQFKGNLTLRLNDNNMITFNLIKTEQSFIGNSQVAHGIFLLNKVQLKKINRSEIKTLSFRLDDNLIHTYEAKQDAATLMNQSNCL